MRSLFRGLFVVFFLFSSIFSALSQNYKRGVIHVKLKSNSQSVSFQALKKTQSKIVLTGNQAIDRVSQEHHTTSIERVFKHSEKFEFAHQQFGLHLWYEIRFDSTHSLNAVVRDYLSIGHFEKVETVQQIFHIGAKSATLEPTPLTTPTNDPSFGLQWHYKNTGQTGGKIGADISLEQAWITETGKKDVIVAIIDGGIDINHPDLKNALWVNSKEIPANGIDDDKNGYVDDVNGYGFGDNTGTIYPNFHGTHVAGTIGAITNNSVGVSGIAGGSGSADGVRLMSCAGFGKFGTGGFENAMVYAADNGAVISQNSWGGGSSAIESAIDYFVARAGLDNTAANFSKNIQIGPMAGGIVIFAAGNSNSESPSSGYPGSYASCFSVASTDHNDVRSSFSNYGSWVEIAAPGSNVYSTYPTSLGSYEYLSGTSMACPHVSGVAGLIISKFGGTGFLPIQLKDRLTSSADNIDSSNPSFIGKLGAGRLNANSALQVNDGIAPDPITDLSIQSAGLTSVNLAWTATGGSGATGVASFYDLRYSTSPINSSNFSTATKVAGTPRPRVSGASETFKVTGLAATTTYYFAIKASDFFGNISGISNVPSASTLPPPIITVSPTSFSEGLLTGASITKTLTINNTGASALEFDIEIKNASTTTLPSSLIPPINLSKPYQKPVDDFYRKNTAAKKQNAPQNFNATSGPIQFAGGKLFSLGSNEILELNPSTGGIVKRIPTPESVSGGPDGLAYDGQYLYFCNGFGTKNLYRINPADGTIIKSISISSIASMDGLGHNGKYLYVLAYNEGLIYEIDFDGGTIVRTINPGISIGGGMSFGGSRGTIFVSNFSIGIYELDVLKGTVINQFAPTGTIYGLGYSEENGLLYAQNVSNGLIEAYNPNTGKVVSSFSTVSAAALASDEAGTSWLKPVVTTKIIPSGQSLQVSVVFDANGLNGGTYKKIISVVSNDPIKPTVDVPATLVVTGAPNIVVSAPSLAFADTFIGTISNNKLSVSNNGTDNLLITSLTFDNANFSCTTSPFTLTPGQKRELTISFGPTTIGTKLGKLSITTNDPDQAITEIALSGLAVTPPIIGLTPASLSSALPTGGKESKSLTLTNTGGSSLVYSSRIEFQQPTATATQMLVSALSTVYPNNSGVVLSYPDSTPYPKAVGDFTIRSSSTFPLTCLTIDPITNLIYAQRNQGSDFYSFNPTTNAWSALASSPVASGNNGGAAFLNGNIYTSYTDRSQIGIYNIASNSWRTITAPIATGNIGSDGAYIYAIVGTQFTRYNPATNLWDNLPAPPFIFSEWGALVFNKGFLYGHQGNGGTNFARYSVSSQTWSTLPSLPNGAVLGGTIDPVSETYYAYGSYFGNNLYSFNISTRVWSVATIPLFAVHDGGMAYVSTSGANGIYFLEGEQGVRFGRFETIGGLNWLQITPSSGSVVSSSNSTLTATFDAKGLAGGTYKATVTIQNNDPLLPEVSVPVTLVVTSAPDIIVDKSSIDFGQTFINQTKTETIVVKNEGKAQLTVTSLTFNSTLFSTSATPFSLAPGVSQPVPIAFRPTASGSSSAQLTISSNDPDEASRVISLNGVGIEPPKIDVTPTSISLTLNSGETATSVMSIKNSGAAKLIFSSEVKDVTGPASISSIKSLASFPETTREGIDGAKSKVTKLENMNLPFADLAGIKVGFVSQNTMDIVKGDIAARGGTSATLSSPFSVSMLNTFKVISIDDAIIGLSSSDLTLLTNWVKLGGGLVVMADDSPSITAINSLLAGTGISETSISYSDATLTNVKVHPTTAGVSAVRADSYGTYMTVTGSAQTIVFDDLSRPHIAVSTLGIGKVMAIGNELMIDFQIGSADNRKFSNQIIDWLVGNTWISMPVADGEVVAGQKADLDVQLNATNLFEGRYTANIILSSNDPTKSSITVPVTLNVIGVPIIDVKPTSLNFGTLFTGSTLQLAVNVRNSGTKSLAISSITISSAGYNHNGIATAIAAGASYSFNVTASPTKAGSFPSTLTINSNDSKNSSFIIPLTMIVQDPPSFSLDKASLNMVMLTNTKKNESVVVSNNGGSQLNFSGQVQYLAPSSLSSVSVSVQSSKSPNNNDQIVYQPSTTTPLAPGDFIARASSSTPLTAVTIDPTTNIIYAQQNQGFAYYSYNLATNTWSLLQPSPLASGNNGGSAFLNGKIYTVYTEFPQMGIYTIATNSWTTVSSPFSTGNITSDGTYLYTVVGTSFRRYNPATNVWDNLASPPFSFWSWGALVHHNGLIYGHEGNGFSGFASYSIASQSWKALPSLPGGAVLGAAVDPYSNTYYTYGSYGSTNFYSFDIAKEIWSTATIPLFSVSDGGMAYVNQSNGTQGVYFVQGENGIGFARFETRPGFNWLKVTPVSGSIGGGTSQPLQIDYDTKGLALGDYKANIVFTTNVPSASTITLPVNLTVASFVNTPPVANKKITDRRMIVASSFAVKLDSIFSDGDGQALSYSAVTSNGSLASAMLSGNLLTINAVSPGEVVIAVSAKDTFNASVTTSFKVTVFANTPPSVLRPITDRQLKVGKILEIKLDSVFFDLDGPTLTYLANSTNSAIASSSLTGNLLTITGNSIGEVVMNSSAKDPFGAQVATTFKIKVYTNTAPFVSQQIANQAIRIDKTLDINLAQIFSDPEGQLLAFSGLSTSVATMTFIGSVLRITPKAIGATTLSIKATDSFGETVSIQFLLTVLPKNEAPVVSNPMQPVELKILGSKKDSLSIDLTNHFSDPNKDPLVFSASISNETLLTHKFKSNRLTLYAQQPGSAVVTITAKDPDNLFATMDLRTIITIVTGFEPSIINNSEPLLVSPNPVQSSATIQYYLEKTDLVNLSLQDLQGRKIIQLINEIKTEGQHKIILSADDLSEGVYIVQLVIGSKASAKRILIIK
jgi:subtilisin family serine protease